MSDRVIVVGDVHGCLGEFQALVMDKLGFQPGDRVILLGDLMDKGPKPLECLRWAQEQGFGAVASNHEAYHAVRYRRRQAFIEKGRPDNSKPWPHPEDEETNRLLTEEDVRWIESLPPWTTIVPGWVAVHGGFNPNLPLEQQDPEKVRNMRYVDEAGKNVPIDYSTPGGPKKPAGTIHWADRWQGPDSVIYGHEAFSLSNPRVTGKAVANRIVQTVGIDTGCVHGGRLTALEFVTLRAGTHYHYKVEQVPSRQIYAQPLAPIPS